MNNYGDQEVSKFDGRKINSHVAVWEDFMDVPVPLDDEGVRCHIHHIDGNPRNNDILNLVCVERKEHFRIHKKERMIAVHKANDGREPWNKGKKTKQESIDKMIASNKGRVFTEEHRLHLSESGKGRKLPPVSEETRKKMSEARKGRKLPPHSEETRKKMSEAAKNRPRRKLHKEGDIWTHKNGNRFTMKDGKITYLA